MHIVSEIMQDQTASLALVPSASGSGLDEPDFVNTQAIIARSLATNLAYPEIQGALSELLMSEHGSPEIEMLSPRLLGIEGRRVSFGTVQQLLQSRYNCRATALGWFEKAQLVMVPPRGAAPVWDTSFRVIVIIRKQGKTEE